VSVATIVCLSSHAIAQPAFRRSAPPHAVLVAAKAFHRDLATAAALNAALRSAIDTTWVAVRPHADMANMVYASDAPPPPPEFSPDYLVALGKQLRVDIVIDVAAVGDSVEVHVTAPLSAARRKMGTWSGSSSRTLSSIVGAFKSDTGVARVLRANRLVRRSVTEALLLEGFAAAPKVALRTSLHEHHGMSSDVRRSRTPDR
jgi:hypothetical protein